MEDGFWAVSMAQQCLKSVWRSVESFVERAIEGATCPPSDDYIDDILVPIGVTFIVILAACFLTRVLGGKGMIGRRKKLRGVDVHVAGPGFAKRNHRFLGFVETPWEGGTTIASVFEGSAQKHSHRPCLGTRKLIKKEMEVNAQAGKSFEKLTLGDYSYISYGDALEVVKKLASAFVYIGHGVGERLAIFAETREEWQITLQACARQSITVVTVYASLGEDALVHALNETECSTVVCDAKQFDKLTRVAGRLANIKRVVYIEEDGVDHSQVTEKLPKGWVLHSFNKLKEIGHEHPTEDRLPSPKDVAVIMYTSGSTGLPKGVMVTHGNLVAVATAVTYTVPGFGIKDVYLSFLPLAHIFALIAEVTMLSAGVSIGYGSPLTISDSSSKIKKGTLGDARALRPTLMIGVPTILDRIRDGVRKQVDKKGGFSRAVFDLAYMRCLQAIEGKWFGACGPERWFWNALVFRKIRNSLGGRLRGVLSGGAPLSGDSQRFMNICFGFPIVQGYGLTETCAGSCFTEFDDMAIGRVGPPLPCCFVKLIDWEEGNYRTTDTPKARGEVCVGGPSVTLGYFKNPEKTAESYKTDSDGIRWFHSGDIGQWHDDGCLEIIDRKKDIVKLQMGEYVSLGKVEAVLGKSTLIDNIMVHADPLHSYAVALVAINYPHVREWAEANGQEAHAGSAELLCNNDVVNKEVMKSIQKVAKEEKLERFEVPAKIKLLPEPWTPENGMVTAAMKLKREVIRDKFRSVLADLYK